MLENMARPSPALLCHLPCERHVHVCMHMGAPCEASVGRTVYFPLAGQGLSLTAADPCMHSESKSPWAPTQPTTCSQG